MSRRRSSEPSRIGAMLFAVGCMSVLSLAFLGGVAAGRHWPRWLPMLAGAAPRAERELPAGPAGEARPGDRMRGPEPAPLLTFYHELTAPLTAPPPPKPRGADKPAPAKPRPAAAAGDADARSASATILVAPPGLPDGPRYAVQVGAFRERGPAETMRATLAGVGWDAYLAEIQGPDVVRYRVRVGSYATRDEARQAADRLSSERRLSTYVTAR